MIAYTIVSRAYLAHARVLARSYAEHHPGEQLRVLLVDDLEKEIDATREPFAALRLTELGMETAEVHRMAMLFGSRLIAAIKPWVFGHLLDQGHDAALYVDSDIVVYDDLEPLAQASADGVVLVPHVLAPMPRDGCDPDETRILGVGQFNAGLFGTGVDDGGFVSFLQERLRRECRFDMAAMRVNEQRWLDFVPSLFPCRVVRDPGVDVAYWNLHERPLARRGGHLFAGDGPLRCFHFSSFDPRMETVAGRYEVRARPRVSRGRDPLLDELCAEYAARLFEEGFADLHRTPFAFDSLPDGTPVYDSMRALYAQALAEAEASGGPLPPDPFDPAGSDEFRAWAKDAYRRAALPIPHLLDHPVASSDATESGGPPALTVDWLGSLEVGPAAGVVDLPTSRGGGDRPRVVRSRPEVAGFVVYGPRAQLDPGDYRLTIELVPGAPSPGASRHDQALVAEVHLDGYVTGAAIATFADLELGELAVDFVVPASLAAEALLDGLELRVLSRGGVDVMIGGVLLAGTGAEPSRQLVDCVLRNWLPFMAAAAAGRRSGDDLLVDAGLSGTVGYGPNWRLPEGRYLASLALGRAGPAGDGPSGQPVGRRRRPWSRPAPDGTELTGIADPTPFAVVEAVDGELVLASRPIGATDLGSQITVPFTVTAAHAGPDDQIGVRIRTVAPVPPGAGAVIKAVTVEPDRAVG